VSVEGWATEWRVETRRETVAELHAPDVPDAPTPTIWLMDPIDTALVLGSRQRDLVISPDELAARGLSLVHRRSGGGAVLIDASTRWVDVLVPAAGPAWGGDLTEAFRVVGKHWQRAFSSHGIETRVWNDRPTSGDFSEAVCFAGMGWGELALVDSPGVATSAPRGLGAAALSGTTKVLGLSQRRTRWGTRLQCLIVNRDHTQDVAAILGRPEARTPQRAQPGSPHALSMHSSEAASTVELFAADTLAALVEAFVRQLSTD